MPFALPVRRARVPILQSGGAGQIQFGVDALDLFDIDGRQLLRVTDEQCEVAQSVDAARQTARQLVDRDESRFAEDRLRCTGGVQTIVYKINPTATLRGPVE